MKRAVTGQLPPTPRGHPLLGQTIPFARDAFGCVERLTADHGDVVGIDVVGIDDLYLLAHPDYVEQALVTERDAFVKGYEFEAAFGDGIVGVDGDRWAEQREFVQPFFYLSRICEYTERMARQAERRIDRWENGATLPVLNEMKNVTLDVIFATVFGRELAVDGDERLRRSADGLNGRFAPTSWVLPEWLPTPSRWRFERSVETLHEEVDRLLAEADEDGDDFVSMLAHAHDGDGYPHSTDEIRDQLVGMIFAGHETTALVLAFAWYLLSEHPRVRQRFHAELDDVLGGKRPTMEDLPDLSYTECVLKETMRLYPPIHGLPRETARPVDVGDYRLPKGATVLLSTYLIHRDERFFEDPLSFRPERWEGDLESCIPDFAYFPFGGGPRRCLGQQFAMVEAKAVLGTVARRYELDYVVGELELNPQMTMNPAGNLPMRATER